MRRVLKHPLFWLAVLVAVGLVVLGAVRALGPVVPTVAVRRADLEQHVVASGRVWTATRVQVAAPLSGRVVAVLVREGQRVSVGDVMVQLDDTEARAAVEQADALVHQGRARIGQQRRVGSVLSAEASRRAQADVASAQLSFDRIAQLHAQGAAPAAELDAARDALAAARSRATAAQAAQLAAAPAGVDTQLLTSGLMEAQAQLALATQRLAQTKITALSDGMVLSRMVEPGDQVMPTRTLLILASAAERTQLVFQLDERNLGLVHEGQAAQVSADAYPGQVFAATVTFIAPAVDPDRGSLEVRLTANRPPAFLRPEMTVSVDLTVATRHDVLVLPSAVVHAGTSAHPWVYVVESGHVARRDVVLGIRGEGAVEVVAPLTEGLAVVLPDAVTLRAGQRVRASPQEPG